MNDALASLAYAGFRILSFLTFCLCTLRGFTFTFFVVALCLAASIVPVKPQASASASAMVRNLMNNIVAFRSE